MITAHDVAMELRKLADAMDESPETETVSAHLYFSFENKRRFLDMVRILPHPLKKSVTTYLTNPDIHIEYESNALNVIASVPQSLVCTLVSPAQPAKYRCEPLLSEDEDAELISIAKEA